MNCRLVKAGQLWTCLTCGVTAPDTQDAPPTRECRVGSRTPGLGDMVAAGLAAVGVTKERVSAALGRPCNCPQRQQQLNEIGKKYLGIGVDNP